MTCYRDSFLISKIKKAVPVTGHGGHTSPPREIPDYHFY
jgi:hypothetical protein